MIKTHATNDMRIERDSMGELAVPADALYGAQTQRAINNFKVSGQRLPLSFIRALLQIKSAAAAANAELGLLPATITTAIIESCTELLAQDDLMQHFPVDVFQTGSGTSTNMNANEVIAHLASKQLGVPVSPNDDVNFGQSSNDVIPTAIHVNSALRLHQHLLPALTHLTDVINHKAASLTSSVKTGRTHLMDAMPLTFAQSLSGWAAQTQQAQAQLESVLPDLRALAQGGTAVGTGVNTHREFSAVFCRKLGLATGLDFRPADNCFAAMASQDTAVNLSGALKRTAVVIMKIANDLRWMNSGPLGGLGEITLPSLQPGSSIMPGKVNPVIPESAAMVAAQVMGNDVTITVAAQSGNFELNVMLPLIANTLSNSIEILGTTAQMLADSAIADFTVNEDLLQATLHRNPVLATALNPVIGYLKAAEIAKAAFASGRTVIDVAEEQTDLPREQLEALLDPVRLTRGGLQ